MRIIDITPIGIWIEGETRYADRLGVYNFHNYNFDGSDSAVSYRLGILTQNEGEELPRLKTFSEGSVIVPDSVVQTWGTDDDPIIQFVLDSLNLQEAD